MKNSEGVRAAPRGPSPATAERDADHAPFALGLDTSSRLEKSDSLRSARGLSEPCIRHGARRHFTRPLREVIT